MKFFEKVAAMKGRNEYYDHDVYGQNLRFYTLRMRWLWNGQLGTIIQPVMKAVTTLFSTSKQDCKSTQVVEHIPTEHIITSLDADGNEILAPANTSVVTNCIEPANPQLVEFRANRRDGSFAEAMGVLFDQKTAVNLGRILMDSLRDDCPANPNEKQVLDFLDQLDFDLAREMFVGFFKANASKMSAPVKEWLASVAKAATSRAQKALDDLEPESSPPTNSDSDRSGPDRDREIETEDKAPEASQTVSS